MRAATCSQINFSKMVSDAVAKSDSARLALGGRVVVTRGRESSFA
jgi:hypothetical protein